MVVYFSTFLELEEEEAWHLKGPFSNINYKGRAGALGPKEEVAETGWSG